MKSLQSLVKVLRASEKRLLLHYYSRDTNSEEKLRLKLFRLVEKGVQSDSEARKLLNSSAGPSAYSHLKSRLKNDILNVLLTQDTSKRLAQANRAAELDCRKKVAQSHVLLLRGAQIEGLKVLKSALSTAEKFELIGEKLQMNHLLREYFISSASSVELKQLNANIKHDLKRYEILLYVEEQSVVLSSPEMGKSIREKRNEKKYEELINELGELYKRYKLARIGFWYYMAATEFYTTRKDFERVLELGLKFLKLVVKSPAVKSKNNVAGVNQTVGYSQVELRNFDQAVKHLGDSEKLFPFSGFNRLQCLQFLALAQVANQKYPDALQTINKALTHPRIKAREPLVPRWLFIRACTEFLNGNVDASFKTLNQDGYLIKQRDAWNIQYRLLEMMQLVEMADEEWLEFKLDATRKFLTRHKILDDLRVRAAIDILGNLLRKNLDYSEISEKNVQVLQSCLNEFKGYEWNPTGPEIVRFDLWIESKLPSLNQE